MNIIKTCCCLNYKLDKEPIKNSNYVFFQKNQASTLGVETAIDTIHPRRIPFSATPICVKQYDGTTETEITQAGHSKQRDINFEIGEINKNFRPDVSQQDKDNNTRLSIPKSNFDNNRLSTIKTNPEPKSESYFSRAWRHFKIYPTSIKILGISTLVVASVLLGISTGGIGLVPLVVLGAISVFGLGGTLGLGYKTITYYDYSDNQTEKGEKISKEYQEYFFKQFAKDPKKKSKYNGAIFRFEGQKYFQYFDKMGYFDELHFRKEDQKFVNFSHKQEIMKQDLHKIFSNYGMIQK